MPTLSATRALLDGSHANSEMSEASTDRLSHLEERERAELLALDEHLEKTAERVVDVEKGLDEDFVSKYMLWKGPEGLRQLFFDLSSTSPEKGLRQLRAFGRQLTAPDPHKALYQGLTVDHSFLVHGAEQRFTNYAVQIWRHEIEGHIIKLLAGLGSGVSLSDLDKSHMTEQMMASWMVDEQKQNDVGYALQRAMWTDIGIRDKGLRTRIESSMRGGVEGKLLDQITLRPGSRVRILVGGGFLTIPHKLLQTMEVKFAAAHDGRIYFMMKNGCRANLGVVDGADLTGDLAERKAIEEARLKSDVDRLIADADAKKDAGDLDEARAVYEEAKVLLPSDTRADAGLAEIDRLERDASYDKAMADALVHRNAKEFDAAIDDYVKALSIKDNDSDANKAIEETSAEAYDHFADLGKIAETNADAHKLLDEYEEAKKNFTRALHWKPDDSFVLAQLANIERKIEVILFDRAVRVGDDSFDHKKYEDAVSAYEEALGYRSGDENVKRKLEKAQSKFDKQKEKETRKKREEEIARKKREEEDRQKEKEAKDRQKEKEAKDRQKEKEAKDRQKEKEARDKQKEKEAKDRQKEKEAKDKQKEKEAKDRQKEKEAKDRQKEKEAKDRQKEKEAKDRQKEKEAKDRQKEKEAKDRQKEKEAKYRQKEKETKDKQEEKERKKKEKELKKQKKKLRNEERKLKNNDDLDKKAREEKENELKKNKKKLEELQEEMLEEKEKDTFDEHDRVEENPVIPVLDEDLERKRDAEREKEKLARERAEKEKRLEEKLKKDKAYDDAIAQGDAFVDVDDLEQAKQSYETALTHKPGDTIAQQKIEAIEKQLLDKAKEDIDKADLTVFLEGLKQKETLSYEEAVQLVEKLNNHPDPLTVSLPQLRFDQLLVPVSHITTVPQFNLPPQTLHGNFFVPHKTQEYIVTHLDPKHRFDVAHPGIDRGTINIDTKHFIDKGLYTGNYDTNKGDVVTQQNDRLYITSLIRKSPGSTIYLPPYDHKKSGGKSDNAGRVTQSADVFRYYKGAGSPLDVKNHVVITTDEKNLGEETLQRLRLMPTKMLELPALDDLQDVTDIDLLLTGKSWRYRQGLEGGKKKKKDKEKHALLAKKFDNQGKELSLTTSLGSRHEGLNLGLVNLQKEHTEVSKKMHMKEENQTDFGATELGQLTAANPWYKIDYLGENLAQYRGSSLALGLHGVSDQVLLQKLLGKLQKYEGNSLTLGCENIDVSTVSVLAGLQVPQLDFWHNPCGASPAIMQGLFSYLKGNGRGLRFYTFTIDDIVATLDAWSDLSGLDGDVVSFDAVSWDDVWSHPDVWGRFKDFPGTIKLSGGVLLSDGIASRAGERWYERTEERLPRDLWEKELEKDKQAFIPEEDIEEVFLEEDEVVFDDMPIYETREPDEIASLDPSTVSSLSSGSIELDRDKSVGNTVLKEFVPDLLREPEIMSYSAVSSPVDRLSFPPLSVGGKINLSDYIRYRDLHEETLIENDRYFSQRKEADSRAQQFVGPYDKAHRDYEKTTEKLSSLMTEFDHLQEEKQKTLAEYRSLPKRKIFVRKKLEKEIALLDLEIDRMMPVIVDLQGQRSEMADHVNDLREKKFVPEKKRTECDEELAILSSNQMAYVGFLDDFVSILAEKKNDCLSRAVLSEDLFAEFVSQEQLNGLSIRRVVRSINGIDDKSLRTEVLRVFLFGVPETRENLDDYITKPASMKKIPVALVMTKYFGMSDYADGKFPENEMNGHNLFSRRVLTRMENSADYMYWGREKILSSSERTPKMKTAFLKLEEGKIVPDWYNNMLARHPREKYRKFDPEIVYVADKGAGKMGVVLLEKKQNADGSIRRSLHAVQVTDDVITGRKKGDTPIRRVTDGRTPGGAYLLAKGNNLQTKLTGPFLAMIPLDGQYVLDNGNPTSSLIRDSKKSTYRFKSTAGIHKGVLGRDFDKMTRGSASCINAAPMGVLYDRCEQQKYGREITTLVTNDEKNALLVDVEGDYRNEKGFDSSYVFSDQDRKVVAGRLKKKVVDIEYSRKQYLGGDLAYAYNASLLYVCKENEEEYIGSGSMVVSGVDVRDRYSEEAVNVSSEDLIMTQKKKIIGGDHDMLPFRSALLDKNVTLRQERVRIGSAVYVINIAEKKPIEQGYIALHDNENTAFTLGMEGVLKYGGRLVALETKEKRNLKNGKDPNRIFSDASMKKLTDKLIRLLPVSSPIISLHNNLDGHGHGKGHISLDKLKTKNGYAVYDAGGDPDNMIWMAARGPSEKITEEAEYYKSLGINVVVEFVTGNDGSMSNRAVHQGRKYYNIEMEHGALSDSRKYFEAIRSFNLKS